MRKARDLVKSVPRSFSTARTPTPAQMDPSDRYCYNPVLRWNPQVEAYFSKAYGPHHFSRITQALARPSCYSCIRVNTLKSTSDAVIEKLLAIIQETELGNTVDGMHLSESNATAKIDMGGNLKSSLREYNSHLNLDEQKKVAFGNFEQLDSQKKSLETGSISKCQLPGLDYVVFVRGSGPHTIEYGYEIDRPPKEVIVSRKCAEAVLRGAQVYVPGVLACSSHVEKGDVVAVSVAVEQPGTDGGWGVGITRGTVLQGQQTGRTIVLLCSCSSDLTLYSWILIILNEMPFILAKGPQ